MNTKTKTTDVTLVARVSTFSSESTPTKGLTNNGKDISAETQPVWEDMTPEEQTDYETGVSRFKDIRGYWFEGHKILFEIRARQLYREKYPTFEAFCRAEFGMGKSNANRQARSGQVATLLATNVAKPEREGHVRPLLRLDEPGQQITAYGNALARTEADGKPLTGTYVTRAVREILASNKPTAVSRQHVTKADCSPGSAARSTGISKSCRWRSSQPSRKQARSLRISGCSPNLPSHRRLEAVR